LYLGGTITTSNLAFAEQALRSAGKLQLVPPPLAKTPEQIQIDAINEQSERWKKQHFEALAQKPREHWTEAQAKNEADKRIKEQADAEKTIQAIINNYTCNHSRLGNKIDHAKTDQLRRDLRKIEVKKDGKRDALLTLQVVREAISNMPR
jgi:hypothetical protein